jgi:hypothetical protein
LRRLTFLDTLEFFFQAHGSQPAGLLFAELVSWLDNFLLPATVVRLAIPRISQRIHDFRPRKSNLFLTDADSRQSSIPVHFKNLGAVDF